MVLVQNHQSPDGLPVVPLWINGAALPTSKDDVLFPVISSIQDRPIHYAVSATPETAVLAVESAATALLKWQQTTPTYRRNLIQKAADMLDRKGEQIMKAQMTETSCPEVFARFNVSSTSWVREIAAATSQLKGVVAQTSTVEDGQDIGGLNLVVREAIGVVLIIPPYVT